MVFYIALNWKVSVVWRLNANIHISLRSLLEIIGGGGVKFRELERICAQIQALMLTSLSSSIFSLWRRPLLPMIFSCRQMQALFASTTSFRVKRGTSDLLGLSNKDLLVIPLSIKPRSLQASDCLWCDILRSEWIPSRHLTNSLAFSLEGQVRIILWGLATPHTNVFDDSLYGRPTPLDTVLLSMTSRMDSVWETRKEGRNL
mgnify:FL=1